ncbi:MAG: hypothetical protein ACM3US_10800 [Sphingomonadaceae bacterium]
MSEESAELVTIEELERRLGVPRQIIYRRMGKHPNDALPYVDVTKPYHKRRQYRFNVKAVAKYLGIEPR